MLIFTPEIVWHNDIKPVLSLDYNSQSNRLATAGADNNIRVWQLIRAENSTEFEVNEDGSPRLEFLSNLQFHTEAVNSLRFSPCGKYLASASDDRLLVIWKCEEPKTTAQESSNNNENSNNSPNLVEQKAKNQSNNNNININNTAVEANQSNLRTNDINSADVQMERGESKDSPSSHTVKSNMEVELMDCNLLPPPTNQTKLSNSIDLTDSLQVFPVISANTEANNISTNSVVVAAAESEDSSGNGMFGADPAEQLDCKERWSRVTILRGGNGELYDLAWSADSSQLYSCSVDHYVTVFDIQSQRKLQSFEDHNNFVQGLAADPLQLYLASQSSDRSVKIYKKQYMKKNKSFEYSLAHNLRARRATHAPEPAKESQKKKSDNNTSNNNNNSNNNSTISENVVTGMEDEAASTDAQLNSSSAVPLERGPVRSHLLFLDENLPSFFRRLCWSIDGQLLVTPAGQFTALEEDKPAEKRGADVEGSESTESTENTENSMEDEVVLLETPKKSSPSGENSAEKQEKLTPTTYVWARSDLSKPLAHLPYDEPSVCARFCPILFELRDSTGGKNFCAPLAYRQIFALATTKSVLLYDTESFNILATIKHIHHTAITDLAWSADGRALFISSSDGYVSLATFQAKELGSSPLNAEVVAALHAQWAEKRRNLNSVLIEEANKAAERKIKKKKPEEAANNPENAQINLENNGNQPSAENSGSNSKLKAPKQPFSLSEAHCQLILGWISAREKVTQVRLRKDLALSKGNCKKAMEIIADWPQFKTIMAAEAEEKKKLEEDKAVAAATKAAKQAELSAKNKLTLDKLFEQSQAKARSENNMNGGNNHASAAEANDVAIVQNAQAKAERAAKSVAELMKSVAIKSNEAPPSLQHTLIAGAVATGGSTVAHSPAKLKTIDSFFKSPVTKAKATATSSSPLSDILHSASPINHSVNVVQAAHRSKAPQFKAKAKAEKVKAKEAAEVATSEEASAQIKEAVSIPAQRRKRKIVPISITEPQRDTEIAAEKSSSDDVVEIQPEKKTNQAPPAAAENITHLVPVRRKIVPQQIPLEANKASAAEASNNSGTAENSNQSSANKKQRRRIEPKLVAENIAAPAVMTEVMDIL
jgi:chromatin assembly factor 1 subunit B